METIRFGICGMGSFGRTRAKALQKARGASGSDSSALDTNVY